MGRNLAITLMEFGATFRSPIMAAISKATGRYELSIRDVEILLFIAARQKTTQTEIAATIQSSKARGTSQGRISLALSALYRKKLISKQFDRMDQRKSEITLDREGKRLVLKINKARETTYIKIVNSVRISRENSEIVTKVLRAWIDTAQTSACASRSHTFKGERIAEGG